MGGFADSLGRGPTFRENKGGLVRFDVFFHNAPSFSLSNTSPMHAPNHTLAAPPPPPNLLALRAISSRQPSKRLSPPLPPAGVLPSRVAVPDEPPAGSKGKGKEFVASGGWAGIARLAHYGGGGNIESDSESERDDNDEQWRARYIARTSLGSTRERWEGESVSSGPFDFDLNKSRSRVDRQSLGVSLVVLSFRGRKAMWALILA